MGQLMCILRKKIRVICRAAWHRRRPYERAHKHAAFISNPFMFAKELLGHRRSGKMDCSHKEIDLYLKQTYSESASWESAEP